MKLLVIEDEKRMVELLRKGLTEEGHTVACASDGRGALELAANYEFDAIILDIMMPRMDGYELAQRLRSEKVTTPVLMLTARDERARRGSRAGCRRRRLHDQTLFL